MRILDYTSFNIFEINIADPGAQYNSRTCKIQTLYVSFRDLQWQVNDEESLKIILCRNFFYSSIRSLSELVVIYR